MTTALIIVGLLILAGAIIYLATRRKDPRPYGQHLEQDTAWNDPVTPADKPHEPEDRRA